MSISTPTSPDLEPEICLAEKIDFLKSRKVKYLRALWCDCGGIIRAKAIHVDRLEPTIRAIAGISEAQMAVPATADVVVAAAGLPPVGEAWLAPVWETLAVLPYAPGHAVVVADMIKPDGPWDCCPRNYLREAARAAEAYGLEIQASFENEFTLFRPTENGWQTVDETPFASTGGMQQSLDVINDITDALIAQGLEVERYYSEGGPGQHEISIRHDTPLVAADHQLLFRETVRGVAYQYGLAASFLPKIDPQTAGNGCHLHLGLYRREHGEVIDLFNVESDSALPIDQMAQKFMAGILHHLPGLMALTTPSANSLERLKPSCWAGAYSCWGIDNREAAIRVISEVDGSLSHMELKTVDATANPYLALGGAIWSGLEGIDLNRPLPEAVDFDPNTLGEKELATRGIAPLPGNFGEVLENLDRDRCLIDSFPPPLYRAYRAVKQEEFKESTTKLSDSKVTNLIFRY